MELESQRHPPMSLHRRYHWIWAHIWSNIGYYLHIEWAMDRAARHLEAWMYDPLINHVMDPNDEFKYPLCRRLNRGS